MILRSGVLIAALLLAVLTTVAAAASSWQEEMALRDSLSRVHPRFRASWLKERGVRDEYWQGCVMPVDSGLRCVGRWSFGPSYDVDGRVTPTETLVALARGSGVSLIRFARGDSIELGLLADVNAGGLMKRVAVRDSLLYVGSTAGLEIWSITDERDPCQLSWLHTALNDFDVQDSLAYVIGPDDSFKVYNIANPASPVFRGACRDSGDLVSVAGDAAFLGDRWGLYVVDVSNPAAPHRIGSWGSDIIGLGARNHLCYATNGNPNQPDDLYFSILDVSTPGSPVRIGYLPEAGGYDICLLDTLAFLSGYGTGGHEFSILSIADSTQPRLLGSAGTIGLNWGVWASGLARSGFVADAYRGLEVFDTRNTSQPVGDTGLLGADEAVDVHVDGGRAYVADYLSSLQILDVSEPTAPALLGSFRPGNVRSAVGRDSFAYISWPWPRMLTIDVSDPVHPESAGACVGMFAYPGDMVIRDSFVYCAEMNRFQVVNVARPRQPVLVGSCVSGDYAWGLDLSGDLAAIARTLSLQLVDVSRPDSPRVVGEWQGDAAGVDIVDTIVYAAASYTGIAALSITDPAHPRVLDSLWLTDTLWWNDVAVIDSLAYVGGERIWGVDVADPQNLHLVPRISWTPPYLVRRLSYSAPYLFAACYEAGVCILETVSTAVVEPVQQRTQLTELTVTPTIAVGCARVRVSSVVGPVRVAVLDATGRELHVARQERRGPAGTTVDLRVADLPPGVYIVRAGWPGRACLRKLVKLTRRH